MRIKVSWYRNLRGFDSNYKSNEAELSENILSLTPSTPWPLPEKEMNWIFLKKEKYSYFYILYLWFCYPGSVPTERLKSFSTIWEWIWIQWAQALIFPFASLYSLPTPINQLCFFSPSFYNQAIQKINPEIQLTENSGE